MKPTLLPTAAASLCVCGVLFVQTTFAQDASTNSAFFEHFGADVFTGVDYWHGFPDGSYPGNYGFNLGGNLAYVVLPSQGIGLQAGGSYGVCDLNGRGSTAQQGRQEQTFFTTGAFYRGPEDSIVSGGIVYDLMLNHNFGVFATDSLLQQLRAQLAVKVYGEHEIGVWGAMELNRASAFIATGGTVNYRAINQASIFYHYSFAQGAEARLWVGLPFTDSLTTTHNSVGTFVLGARASMPFNDHLSLVADAAYMSPHAQNIPIAAQANLHANEISSVSLGISWSFGGKSQSRSSAYLPVANNSTFFVDGSTTE